MKLFIVSSLFLILSISAVPFVNASALPDCKNVEGAIVPNTLAKLKTVMSSSELNPQVIATGVVTQILPEDHKGLPHQKYILTVAGQLKLMIVSNLDFGRVPLAIGSTLSVCGEFKKVGGGMIHWTHFDPHGGHPDGFTIVNGALFGDKEIPGFMN
jgi:hypothetical protein